MKCLCIGICQVVAIADILRSIPQLKNWIILDYTIFTLTEDEMKNILDNVLPTCDLILSQPVSDNYRNTNIFSSSTLRARIPKKAKHFILANCYFTGYDPVPFQTTNGKGEIIHLNNISYFPSICLNSLLQSDIESAKKNWCNIQSYSLTELEKNVQNSLDELKRRENKVFDNDFPVDIKISDYIENNYKKKFLFHTYNHPTNELLFELVRRILKRLNISVNIALQNEKLGSTSIPPCLSVYLLGKMEFVYPKFIINNIALDTDKAMNIFASALKTGDIALYEQWRNTISYGRSKIQ